MPLRKAIPVLAALNVPRLANWYKDKLNFKIGFCDEGYGIIGRDDIIIHFWHANDEIFPKNTSCYIDVDEVDELYEEMKAAGVVHPNGPLKNQPHGMREFAILDLDGNLIRFGQPLEDN
ncbi:hypothetical protein BXY85_3177 [Roseivirga pacifica]|uniref:Bleomycin resistance protein n=1 Tax=Roseivirga pacifica TaxID=1267423 RepID=A0A1I0QU27_9BACT|nr:VOC family protein [Roseivirga pacifica]RKQ42566.1 hypothetical protein BXY85_3177 [Roseivirga pacifica]SEW30915.1 hypothetical protein SAMN05216290_2698 [Roseivirga pacifica]